MGQEVTDTLQTQGEEAASLSVSSAGVRWEWWYQKRMEDTHRQQEILVKVPLNTSGHCTNLICVSSRELGFKVMWTD